LRFGLVIGRSIVDTSEVEASDEEAAADEWPEGEMIYRNKDVFDLEATLADAKDFLQFRSPQERTAFLALAPRVSRLNEG
jgi:hypothetical protein